MADFSNVDPKIESVFKAGAVRNSIKTVYQQAKATVALMNTYTAGSDLVFNGVINGVYSVAQRTELGVVRDELADLAAYLEANHASLIGFDEGE